MEYEAVVFDKDGVLVEGTDGAVMRQGVENGFRAAGVADPASEHVSAFTHFSAVTVEKVCEVGRGYGLDPESLWIHREEEVSAAQQAAVRRGEKGPFGDLAAVEELADAGLALGVASNNQQATVEFVVEQFGLGDLFGAVHGVEPTLDGIRRKKPDPYYLNRAVAELDPGDTFRVGADETDVLYVGDKETDVRAARWAGFDAVYLRRREDDPDPGELSVAPEFTVESLEALPAIVAGERAATPPE